MKNLREITIGFENCECYSVSSEDIGNIIVSDIHSSIERVAANCVTELKTAHNVRIVFLKKANIPCIPFKDATKVTTLFSRLNSDNSITAIKFTYEDGSSEDISLVWKDGNNSGNNEYQKVYTTLNDDECVLVVTDNNRFNFI